MAANRVPLPPFPRWCGMHITLSPPRQHGTHLATVIHVPPVTLRARLWWAWRLITHREVPDAATDR